jgi:hypothetical protein
MLAAFFSVGSFKLFMLSTIGLATLVGVVAVACSGKRPRAEQ